MFDKTETQLQRRDRYLRKAEEARALSQRLVPANARDVVLRVADDWLTLAKEVELAMAHGTDARDGALAEREEQSQAA